MRQKSFMNMSAQELQNLREAIEQENARRALLSSNNESIAAIIEAVKKNARELNVTTEELLTAVVAIVLPDHDVYLKRGRKVPAKKKTKK